MSIQEEMADDKVSEFCTVTGADVPKAVQILQATDFNLQEAIELYFASGEGQKGGVAEAGGPPGMSDEALAKQMQESSVEHVRAPMPTKVDRLYGDDYGSQRQVTSGASIMDAFRNREPGNWQAEGRLSSMFEPPREIIFSGGFEDAKQDAQERKRWLVVNIQSPSNFDSHRLNRDTWRDGAIKALVEAYFVLFQTYDVAEQGQEMMAYYDVAELPVILVVDPVTGAPMRRWYGFVDAVELAERFVPFTEIVFDDPRAARLAASSMRKRHGAPLPQEEAQPDLPVECAQVDTESPESIATKALDALPPEESGSGTCRIGECLSSIKPVVVNDGLPIMIYCIACRYPVSGWEENSEAICDEYATVCPENVVYS